MWSLRRSVGLGNTGVRGGEETVEQNSRVSTELEPTDHPYNVAFSHDVDVSEEDTLIVLSRNHLDVRLVLGPSLKWLS